MCADYCLDTISRPRAVSLLIWPPLCYMFAAVLVLVSPPPPPVLRSPFHLPSIPQSFPPPPLCRSWFAPPPASHPRCTCLCRWIDGTGPPMLWLCTCLSLSHPLHFPPPPRSLPLVLSPAVPVSVHSPAARPFLSAQSSCPTYSSLGAGPAHDGATHCEDAQPTALLHLSKKLLICLVLSAMAADIPPNPPPPQHPPSGCRPVMSQRCWRCTMATMP